MLNVEFDQLELNLKHFKNDIFFDRTIVFFMCFLKIYLDYIRGKSFNVQRREHGVEVSGR